MSSALDCDLSISSAADTVHASTASNRSRTRDSADIGAFFTSLIELRTVASHNVREAATWNSTAIDYMKAENWNLEAALNRFFNSAPPPAGRQQSSGGNAEQFFEKFKSEDSEEDKIDCEGVGKLIESLGIEPDDKALIAFAYHCGAANMGEFSREEFLTGCTGRGCHNLKALKAALPALRKEFDREDDFRKVYLFTFKWACEPGKKILGLPTALALWQILFSGGQSWSLSDEWCKFLEAEHGRPLNEDTWKLLLDFKKEYPDKNALSSFDGTAQAWPYLIDDFVAAIQEGSS